MSAEPTVDELEQALLQRAHRLADECLARGRQVRDQILREEEDRLRLREEREVLVAQQRAERDFRRRVQASELHVQENLDRLRWRLVQQVLEEVRTQLAELSRDAERYRPVLHGLIGAAADELPGDSLCVELNRQDAERFGSQLQAGSDADGVGKHLRLVEQPLEALGGARLSTEDGDLRIDNTFEGRLDRFADQLHQIISERLFAHTANRDELLHG